MGIWVETAEKEEYDRNSFSVCGNRRETEN